jgi:DNA-binding transcriptional LysR family regulator
MELSQLNYFRTTARLEHFTQAAKELHITQPSLSKAIANLEEELGIPLFDREGKNVRLNEYGKALLPQVDRILDLVEEAVFQLQDMAAGQRGQVRIGASFPITPPSPVYYYQYDFFHSHPQVALFLHVHSGGRIESMLEERELDFGISLAPATHFGIASQPLYTDKLGIIVGPNHPLAEKKQVALKELKDEPFLCNTSAPDPNDSAHHLCGLAGFRPEILYEGESSELIGESVAMGYGVSFVSHDRYYHRMNLPNLPEWERELRYVELSDPFCTRTVYLHFRGAGYLSQAAQEFHRGLNAYLG